MRFVADTSAALTAHCIRLARADRCKAAWNRNLFQPRCSLASLPVVCKNPGRSFCVVCAPASIFFCNCLATWIRYLDEHVRGGYQFLMQNYVAGDKICIFGKSRLAHDFRFLAEFCVSVLGFSRGAYTARALAGMLHKVSRHA